MMNPEMRAISTIAYLNWNGHGRHIRASQLRAMLRKAGLRPGEGRVLFTQIRWAYRRSVEEGNQGIADCIASCYLKDDGTYAYR